MSVTVTENERASEPRYAAYWEDRALRYAAKKDGLAAVCAYGMPGFYNWAIDLCQRLALRPWLQPPADAAVLDVGCGIGRWSRMLAARGAQVTGVDLSATMVSEAKRRAEAEGSSTRCRFLVQDLAELDAGARFDLVLGVTVLQHIIDPKRLSQAVARLAAHLAPDGRLVLLEVAPTASQSRCDSPIFQARTLETYRALFIGAGLRLEKVTGVDPVPLKTWFLPYYPRLARPVALLGLAAVTALSVPVDAIFGRRWVHRSWHKLFVLRHAQRTCAAESP